MFSICDCDVVASNCGRVAMKRVLLGRVTVCGKPSHHIGLTNNKVNSAFFPSGVGKSGAGLSGWVMAGRVQLCRVPDNTA